MPEDLIFCDDSMPGIARRRAGRGWCYFDADGERITERAEIDRLNAIALPPAYTDAWYCPSANGHLLATGVDARGRKQYRYHPDFRLSRECVKYDALLRFGEALPRVRQRVADDLAGRGLTRERAIACIVRLLDTAALRVGNETYAKRNRSFGATTLRKRHADFSGSLLQLRFRAKSGKFREVQLKDRSLSRFVRLMQDLPGQHLFQFLDDAGEACPVGSCEVNAYLRETMGEGFSAKHFRTWSASAIGFEALVDCRDHVPIKTVVTEVSQQLGNTPAIARKSYIHPAVIALAADREAQAALKADLRLPRRTRWLSRHERALIAYLSDAPEAAELLAA